MQGIQEDSSRQSKSNEQLHIILFLYVSRNELWVKQFCTGHLIGCGKKLKIMRNLGNIIWKSVLNCTEI